MRRPRGGARMYSAGEVWLAMLLAWCLAIAVFTSLNDAINESLRRWVDPSPASQPLWPPTRPGPSSEVIP